VYRRARYKEKEVPSGRKAFSYTLLLLPALVIYLAVMVLPLLFTLVTSFSSLGKYGELFASRRFWIALRNNALLGAVSVFIQIPLGFLIACILSRSFGRSSHFFRGLFFLPVLIAPLVSGLLARQFMPVALSSHPLLSTLVLTTWMYTGFFVTVFLANLQRIDESILEAASLEGAGEMQIIFSVLLPAQKKVIWICVLLGLIFSLRSFDLVYALSGGSLGPAGTELLSTYLYSTAFGASPDYQLGAALSGVLALISLVLILFLNSAVNNAKPGVRS
jgi:raffinose/stachyose/melibiose transport system permease protein